MSILRRLASSFGPLAIGAVLLAAIPLASAQTLTFTGQVYSPRGPAVAGSTAAHGDPIPNILVFVQDPNSPLPVFSQGVAIPSGGQSGCEVQPSLVPATVLGSARTDPTGTFTFNVAGALPATVNVVIQAGKWRRQYQYTTAQIASFTNGSQVVLPTMSMPASMADGDLPHIAVVTGSADDIECIFPQIGVSPSEITDPLNGGSINFFSGNASSGEIVSSSTPTETQLVNPNASNAIPLTNYDMVIFGCQGPSGKTDSDAAAYAENLVSYANDGGRVFGTHWEYSWIQNATEWSPLADFSSSDSTTNVTTTGQLSTSYSGEPTLAAWMNYIGSFNINPSLQEFTLTAVYTQNVLGVNPPAQTWVTLPDYNNSPNQFSFDTPVGATGVPTAVLNFSNNQTTFLRGDQSDSIVINVTDNSATPTLAGLTLTVSIPSTINPISLADSGSGTWQCNLSTPTATCILPVPLAAGNSDSVTLTFSIPQTATLGPSSLVASLSNGGINQSQQCGRVLYNDYHVESSVQSRTLFNSGASCKETGTLTAAQKFLEYSLYNLSNFVSPTTTDTLDIQNTSTTQITNLAPSINYGQTIGDNNGSHMVVSTSAPGGPDDGQLLVFLDNATTATCTLQNSVSTANPTPPICPDTGFTDLPAGNHTLVASFSGDTDYAASNSPPYTVTISPDSTTGTLATPYPDATVGQPVTLTVNLSSQYATPAGAVTFYSNGTPLGPTATLNANGVATFTTSGLPLGTDTITAVYAPTLNFLTTTIAPVTVNVQPPSTPVGNLTVSPEPSLYSQNFTLTVTLDTASGMPAPTGTITFSVDGAAVCTAVAVASGAATCTVTVPAYTTSTPGYEVGPHTVTAVYSGDGNYNTLTISSPHNVVGLPTTTTLVSPTAAGDINGVVTPIFYGQIIGDVALEGVSESSGAPPSSAPLYDGTNGTLRFLIDGTLTCTLQANVSGACPASTGAGYPVGSYTVQSVYTGDAFYAGSQTPPYPVVIQPDSTTAAVSTSLNPSISGQSVTFTATITAPYANPTGPVIFYDNGSAISGPVTLTAQAGSSTQAVATFTTSSLVVGPHSITVAYAATLNFNASTSSILAQVVHLPPSNTTTTVTSSANPSLLGTNVTFTATVNATPLTVTAPPGYTNPAPTGIVSFYDGTTLLGTGTLSATGANISTAAFSTSALALGTHPITAVYPGDSYNVGSTSSVLNQVVYANTFTLTVAPTALNLAVGSAATVSVTVADVGAFDEPVQLSCTGVANETSCAFLNTTIPAGGGTTYLTITPAPPHACSVSETTASDRGPGPGLPALAGAALVLLATRRRRLFRALALAAALCVLPMLNGCGTSGCTDFGVTPGTYTFTVTAASAAPSAITQTQTIQVTVKP